MTAAPAARLNRLEFAGNLLARGARRTLNLIRSAPATFALIAIIAVTSYLLSQASPAEARHMLLARSTNLHQLTSLNLDVLMRSAFWLEDASELLPWAALFLFVLAPAERWLGTWRWLVVFVAGHIGATAAIGAAIWIAITAGLVSRHLAYSIDVGVSYGFFAVAAIAIYHIPARWRGLFLALLALLQLYGVVEGVAFTAVGHLVAMAIGFALYPLARTRASALSARPRPALAPQPGIRRRPPSAPGRRL